MRPSRRFLWLLLAALVLAAIAVAVPTIAPEWALAPFGVLIAALILDWSITPGPRSMKMTATIDREVFSGETIHLAVDLFPSTDGRRLPQNVKASVDWPDGLKGPQEFSFEPISGALHANVPLAARLRGTWDVPKIWLHWFSRFGLVDFVPTQSIDHTVSVVPNIRPVTSGEIDLKLSSTIFGMKQTAWRGEGSEFHQLTDYVSGMDPRSIDWKHSARHHKMVSKEMRAERNHQIIMALDNGYLMREEVDGLPKIDHKINAALALTWAGVQSGDLVGLFAFDARPRLFVPPASGHKTFSQLRSQMANLEYRSVETNHTLALSHLHQRIQKRSLIVVFSDFVDPLTAELLVDHMAILNKHHVAIFVSLRDPLLEELAKAEKKDMNDIARAVSATNLLQERRSVLDTMAAMGIYVVEADPGGVTPKLLSTYLDIKMREVI